MARRDIVEETLKLLFSSKKWEFEVYGIGNYLKSIEGNTFIEEVSLSGLELKHSYLPAEFFDYMINYYKEKGFFKYSNPVCFWDNIGTDFLTKYKKYNSDKMLLPKLYSDIPLTHPEKAMIATVESLWGYIGYYV